MQSLLEFVYKIIEVWDFFFVRVEKFLATNIIDLIIMGLFGLFSLVLQSYVFLSI